VPGVSGWHGRRRRGGCWWGPGRWPWSGCGWPAG
jgi:hypothetical protein